MELCADERISSTVNMLWPDLVMFMEDIATSDCPDEHPRQELHHVEVHGEAVRGEGDFAIRERVTGRIFRRARPAFRVHESRGL